MSWATMLRKSTGTTPLDENTNSNNNNNQPERSSTPPIVPPPPGSDNKNNNTGRGNSRNSNNNKSLSQQRGNSSSLPPTPPLVGKTSTSSFNNQSIGNNNNKSPKNNNTNSSSTKHKSPPSAERRHNNNNNNNNNEQPHQQQLSFKLSPALPQGTSLRPPPLILTTSSSSTSPVDESHYNNNNGGSSNTNQKSGSKRKVCYSRNQIRNIGNAVINGTPDVAVIEAVINSCPDVVQDVCYDILRREQVRQEQQFSHECSTCSMFDMSSEEIQKGIVRAPPAGACATMQELIKNSLKDCRSSRGLTFICQAPDVVFGQLRVAVAFDPKRAPKKMREMPQRCVDRIKAFVCGDGFHFPPPAQNDHNAWNKFSQALKFDAIMENQTPLFAGFGKFWKRHHSSFEKFVQILFWRDERPNPNNFNMISKNQMPVIVACASGEIDAVVMLLHLRFFVLPDDYMFGFPFMRNLEPLKASVLRHLCRYFYRKQTERALASRGF